MAEMHSNNIAAHFHRCIITVTKVGRMFALVVKNIYQSFLSEWKSLKSLIINSCNTIPQNLSLQYIEEVGISIVLKSNNNSNME